MYASEGTNSKTQQEIKTPKGKIHIKVKPPKRLQGP